MVPPPPPLSPPLTKVITFFCVPACFAGKWGPILGEDFFLGGGGGGACQLKKFGWCPPPPTKTQGPPVPPHWKNPSYATVKDVAYLKGFH